MTSEELHLRRRRLRLTQAELGRMLGVARTTIVRWEAGWQAIPEPERVENVLRRLEAARGLT